jgi:hypothetical protein
MMRRILLAEEERRLAAPKDASGAPTGPLYGFLSELVSERRLDGLERVPDERREIYRAGDYLFHVSLLNRLNHPFRVPPAAPELEPRLGTRFEAWGWPADPADTALVLYFASTSGLLLQGENGAIAGPNEFPADAFTKASPLEIVTTSHSDRWLEVFVLPRSGSDSVRRRRRSAAGDGR